MPDALRRARLWSELNDAPLLEEALDKLALLTRKDPRVPNRSMTICAMLAAIPSRPWRPAFASLRPANAEALTMRVTVERHAACRRRSPRLSST